jgi:uncharacterized protein YodC (DUF2158 family)
MEFKIGDVVEFKSGGPAMTVVGILGQTTSQEQTFTYTLSGHAKGDIICQWFEKGKLETGLFKPETLDKDDDEV